MDVGNYVAVRLTKNFLSITKINKNVNGSNFPIFEKPSKSHLSHIWKCARPYPNALFGTNMRKRIMKDIYYISNFYQISFISSLKQQKVYTFKSKENQLKNACSLVLPGSWEHIDSFFFWITPKASQSRVSVRVCGKTILLNLF